VTAMNENSGLPAWIDVLVGHTREREDSLFGVSLCSLQTWVCTALQLAARAAPRASQPNSIICPRGPRRDRRVALITIYMSNVYNRL
jgi:hypothetical protein